MGTIRTSNSVSATLRRHVIRGFRILLSFHNHEESVLASLEAYTIRVYTPMITSLLPGNFTIPVTPRTTWHHRWYGKPGVYP
jgi:hypothetical protein